MRKFLFPLLMASAMMPVAAAAQDSDGLADRISERRTERAERVSSSDDRPQQNHDRDASPMRAERVQRLEGVQRAPRAERQMQQVEQTPNVEHAQQARHSENNPSGGHTGYHRDVRQDHRDLHASDPNRREHRGYHRDQKRDHRTEHRSWDRNSQRAGHGDYHRDVNGQHGELHASDPTRREHRDGHRDLSRQHDRRHAAWDTSWRSNRSYDWRGYRGRYSSLYNLSPYYDPYGWGYRRFSIGVSIGSGYYGSNYWLNDPWSYRLPPAYGPYRWVRYYDDALLVNIYTGQVVDVINNFFW